MIGVAFSVNCSGVPGESLPTSVNLCRTLSPPYGAQILLIQNPCHLPCPTGTNGLWPNFLATTHFRVRIRRVFSTAKRCAQSIGSHLICPLRKFWRWAEVVADSRRCCIQKLKSP